MPKRKTNPDWFLFALIVNCLALAVLACWFNLSGAIVTSVFLLFAFLAILRLHHTQVICQLEYMKKHSVSEIHHQISRKGIKQIIKMK